MKKIFKKHIPSFIDTGCSSDECVVDNDINFVVDDLKSVAKHLDKEAWTNIHILKEPISKDKYMVVGNFGSWVGYVAGYTNFYEEGVVNNKIERIYINSSEYRIHMNSLVDLVKKLSENNPNIDEYKEQISSYVAYLETLKDSKVVLIS